MFMKQTANKTVSALGATALMVCFANAAPVRAADFQVIYTFPFDGSAGFSPVGPLALGADGNFYGVTSSGGLGGSGFGTVFKVTPQGQLTTIYSFRGAPDGANPVAGVIFDTAGNLYGTTKGGGTVPEGGTVFKIAPNGTETILHSFGGAGDGSMPLVGLVVDGGGNLFGATSQTRSSLGTIFEVTAAGAEIVLHSFDRTDGSDPYGRLLLDSSGTLYGTTITGGAFRKGTVFKITADGAFSTVYSFQGKNMDGKYPRAGLTLAPDGYLYGTTLYGGINHDRGTVYKLAQDGTETVLTTFTRKDGRNPEDDLIFDAKGNIYGTTLEGGRGTANAGVVFRLSPTGKETVLHSFGKDQDGDFPQTALTFDASGSLYGVANPAYPPTNSGTIYKITP